MSQISPYLFALAAALPYHMLQFLSRLQLSHVASFFFCVIYITSNVVSANPLCDFVAATNIESIKSKWSCNLAGEPQTEPCNDWPGVKCDKPGASGVILELDLNNLGVNGTLTESLGTIANLTAIYFADNRMSGTIPENIGELPYLTSLDIAENQLTGTIPATLGSLRNLVDLTLDENLLVGVIPDSLNHLSALEELTLNDNQLTGSIPPGIFDIVSLVSLVLYRTSITGHLDASMCNLSKLKVLSIFSTKLSGSIPTCIGSMTELEQLQMFFNSLTGTLPESLGDCDHMLKINIPGNMFTGTIPATLGKMRLLVNLYLNENFFTGNIPDSLGQLDRMKELYLYQNCLTGTVPASIGTITRLVNVGLQSNLLTGSLPSFDQPVQLIELNLESNCFSGSIPTAFGKLSLIFIMNVSSNVLTGTVPPALAALTQLAYVSLYDNQLTGSLPLLTTPGLATYDASQNRFSGTLSAALSEGIGSINVAYNLLSGDIPTALANYSNLHYVNVAGNNIGGTIPSEMCSSTSMNLDVSVTDIQCYSGCLTSSSILITGASSDCHDGSVTKFFLSVVFICLSVSVIATILFRLVSTDWFRALVGSAETTSIPEPTSGSPLLIMSCCKLVVVVAFSLTMNGWWHANDDSMVESCTNSENKCYQYCGSPVEITTTVVDDDYRFDDVHFPPNINTEPHYSDASYCVAELSGSCARQYWLTFRLVPIMLHVIQFLMQCVAWRIYGDATPQRRQYETIVAYLYPQLLEHLHMPQKVAVVEASPGVSSRTAMLRLLSQPRMFSLFAFAETFSTLYVWGELLYPATYCGQVRPLSLYYYPVILSLLDLTKFNIFLMNCLLSAKSGRDKGLFVFFNLEMILSNAWVSFSLSVLFVCGVFYDIYRGIRNRVLRCRGQEAADEWPATVASSTNPMTKEVDSDGIKDVEAVELEPTPSFDDIGNENGIRLSSQLVAKRDIS